MVPGERSGLSAFLACLFFGRAELLVMADVYDAGSNIWGPSKTFVVFVDLREWRGAHHGWTQIAN